MATETRQEYTLLLDDDLLDDWTMHLRSANRSAGTITSYVMVARHFATFLYAAGMPRAVDKITREHIETYIASRLETCSPATAAKHYRSLQQLFKWLISDGELTRSPMERMSAPTVPEQPVPILSLDDIAAMIATCKGNDFVGRRDEAIIRVLLDTGIRASELVGIGLADVDREAALLFVTGKGGRGRAVPHGVRTADALRRYLRSRQRHPMANKTERLWLGTKGALTTSGLSQLLERRADRAGIKRLHPHMFRHTFAHLWLSAGGQETDLMRLAGWRSREMVSRYAASAADGRAREAHRRMALGDQV